MEAIDLIDSDGNVRQTTGATLKVRERLRQKHEETVAVMDRGDYRTALTAFCEIMMTPQYDPEPMNHLNIAVCHAYLGEFATSLAILEKAIQRWPSNALLQQNYEVIKRKMR